MPSEPRQGWALIAVLALSACTAVPERDLVYDRIKEEMDRATRNRAPIVAPDAVSQALLPPLVVEMPKADARTLDQRFDLNVNNAPANQVFMAIVSGTRYSMVVHPGVKDPISVNLKDTTVPEALEVIRELYGYEYRIQGNRITVQPVTMQTRVFQVNYLQAQRRGRTDVSVSSGSITTASSSGAAGTPAAAGAPAQSGSASARVSTSTDSDFWADIGKSVQALVGAGEGRNVIINPQSGVIVVRALPAELRSVDSFLKAMQLVVDRQVVLEAKIIEVSLRDGYEAGVNWGAFRDGSTRAVAGVVNPAVTIGNTGALNSSVFGATLGAASSVTNRTAVLGGIFGLALQTSNFAALITFLETQGAVNVLSSPRIATINNQKAVLKVGTDEFFVTNVSTTAVTSGAGVTTTPTITVQPFFSGIALDVTPQIDENNNIMLHIHPAVSEVSEKRKDIDLGSVGRFTLPLASSNVNETDTIVRVQDGNIVAIGGLMRQQSTQDRSQVPGAGNLSGIGGLFRQRATSSVKSELVILLKPTIVHSDRNWQQDLADTRERIQALEPPQPSRQK